MRILCMTAAFRTLGFVIFCRSLFGQNEYSQRVRAVKSHKCDYGSMNLMVWSAADPTVQLGYKGRTEEGCHGAIHAGY
jgi:hypothetical protein